MLRRSACYSLTELVRFICDAIVPHSIAGVNYCFVNYFLPISRVKYPEFSGISSIFSYTLSPGIPQFSTPCTDRPAVADSFFTRDSCSISFLPDS